MPRGQTSITRHRRLATRLLRGELPLDELSNNLPNKSLNAVGLAHLCREAIEGAVRNPQFGLATAHVAQMEALRSGTPLQAAEASYALAVCLNFVDDWDAGVAQAGIARQQFERMGREVEVARCDWQAAYALRYLAEYRQGETMAARAERVFRRNQDLVGLSRALVERARNLNQLKRLDEASEALAEARSVLLSTGNLIGQAWWTLAEAARLSQSGQASAAVPQIEQAGLAFRRLGRLNAEAWADFQLGLAMTQMREFGLAAEVLERAARRFRRLGLRLRYALALNQLGVSLLDSGQYVTAQGVLAGAHAQFQKLQPTGLHTGLTRTNLGLAKLMLGELTSAEQLLRSAQTLLARFGAPHWLAAVEAGLGCLDREQGRFDSAIARMESAVRLWRRSGDDFSAAQTLEELASLYLTLGDGRRGAALLQESLDYYLERELGPDAARAKVNLAQAYVSVGRPAGALRLLDDAALQTVRGVPEWLGARIERVRGEALLRLDRFADADLHLGVAAQLFYEQQLPTECAAAALSRAELWWRQGNLDGARQILVSMSGDSPPASIAQSWRFHLLRARLAEHPDEALPEYLQAIASLQGARQSLSHEELAGAYLREHRLVFDEAVRLLLHLGHPEPALEVGEESRAQVLASHLRRSIRAGAALRGARTATRRRRDRLRTAIQLLHEQPAARAGRRPGRPSPERLWSRYLEAAAAARRESGAGPAPGWTPFVWQAFYRRSASFLPADWLGLAYYQLEDQLLIFELASGGVLLHSLGAAQTAGVLAEIAGQAGDGRAPFLQPAGEALRRRLYDLLIPPAIDRRLRPDRMLLVLPCGPLNGLPFHALQDGQGRYLAQRTVVGYAPSLLALHLLATRRERNARERRRRKVSLCLVAHGAGSGWLAPLPAAEREIQALAETFGPQAMTLTDERASLAELIRLSRMGKLAEFEYFHLLAHGQFDERSGRRARLALADGPLLVDDVADLALRAKVVTLSACEAGLHQVYPGEERVGLAQAFLASGADSVVSGLWQLADETLPGMMRQLYKNLLAGYGPAIALCLAQRQALRITPEPRKWAPLTVVGLP